MRVATLNCWNVSEPFAARMALVRAGIQTLAPDVMGLQEIVVGQDGLDQLATIVGGLRYERTFGPSHPSAADGNAIVSRWPIRESAVHTLPGIEGGTRRSVVGVLIETPAGLLPFFATHLNWRAEHGWIRERQVVAVAEFADQFTPTGSLPRILVGDLNARPDSTEVRFLCGLAPLGGRSVCFQDAWQVAGDGTPGFT